jgi:hypothetical protein
MGTQRREELYKYHGRLAEKEREKKDRGCCVVM